MPESRFVTGLLARIRKRATRRFERQEIIPRSRRKGWDAFFDSHAAGDFPDREQLPVQEREPLR